jgi:quinoprotein glucose dehydrogenase
MFRGLRNEGIFTPPSLRGSLIVPGNIGGLHWGGVVFDPVHRLLIAPVNRWPAVVRLIPRDQFNAEKKAHPERETTEQNGTPYSMSRQFFVAPSGSPCTKPPWGELVAVQADTGNIAWRVPLGDLRNAINGAWESQSGSPNLGGLIATSNGLVFIGATLDGYFRAFETEQGREVWKAKLPTSARATPLLFTSAGGRQMIAIAAGGHDSPLSKLDTKLVVFALGDK